MVRIYDLLKDDGGAAGVEYGLLIAAISVAMVAIVFATGGTVEGTLQAFCLEMKNVLSFSASCN